MDPDLPLNPSDRLHRATGLSSGQSAGSRKAWSALFVLIALLVISADSPVSGQASLKHVSFMPQWIPQAQFAGYLVAHDKGFYRRAGLDVTLVPGGPGKNCFTALAAGQVTFCTGWLSTAIQFDGSGLKIVNLAQMMQRSSLLLIAKKSSGIRTPKDLNGKRVGFWVGEFDVPILVFLKKHHLNVKMIPNYTTVTMFLKGAVDAIAAMWYNEYHLIIDSGLNPDDLTVLRFKDLGVDFPEDGLYCMKSTFQADPAMCKAFAAASIQGWKYAFKHQEEAVDIVMKYAKAANTGTNRAHQQWMLAAMKELMLPKAPHGEMGKLSLSDYEKVGKALKSLYLIDHLPKYQDFYRGRQ